MSYPVVSNIALKNAMELMVRGIIKPDAVRFSINVGHSYENVALHVNPRFNYHGDVRTIILNSKQGGSWSQDIKKEKIFPFEAGQEFEMIIVLNSDTFDIYLPNGEMVQFPNRLGDRSYKYIFFIGDVTIRDISVRPSTKPTKR